MMLEQFYIACLSHASYPIGDQTSGRAIVVDPRRDIGDHLAAAVRHGVVIEGSSTPTFTPTSWPDTWKLRRQPGVDRMGAAAETDYPIRRLVDGQRISLGQVELEIVATPGHTWESISVLVRYADRQAVPKAEWTFRRPTATFAMR